MIKKVVQLFLIGILFFNVLPVQVQAQDFSSFEFPEDNFEIADVQEEYFRGKVLKVLEEGKEERYGLIEPFQILEVELLNNDQAGEIIEIEQGKTFSLQEWQVVAPGEEVVIIKTDIAGETQYLITDRYRINGLWVLFLCFFLVVVAITRKRGVMAVIGLFFSFIVLVKGMIPLLMEGYSPFWVSLIGGSIIAFVSIYLAHGFNRRSTIALCGSFLTLAIAVIVAFLSVEFIHLFGLGSEEAFFLTKYPNLNLKGLLLGSMIIGVLGVLDDITTAQVAAVYEIKRANMSLGFSQLYSRSLSVGKEHITSLVNTLVLAYAGASLPLFLLFYNAVNTPFWVIMNGEMIAEEVVRTLVGSMALVIAVPITTVLAAHYFANPENVKAIEESGEDFHACKHH